jgi:hypothetical protein
MSAVLLKAEIRSSSWHVRSVPIVDVPSSLTSFSPLPHGETLDRPMCVCSGLRTCRAPRRNEAFGTMRGFQFNGLHRSPGRCSSLVAVRAPVPARARVDVLYFCSDRGMASRLEPSGSARTFELTDGASGAARWPDVGKTLSSAGGGRKTLSIAWLAVTVGISVASVLSKTCDGRTSTG